MASRTNAFVMKAIRSVAKVATPETTDRDLLVRYVDGDEEAFAVLVARHTAMVLGVCGRALPTIQDAEDATQATFLVLARKSRVVNWQPSVANWLYSTARKISAKAIRTALRRATREGRAACRPGASTLNLMSGREAFAILDEELGRLAPRYREPLVLCYLQGLTRDEAATRLAVSPATLKSQLERGRKRLGAALTKRGVAIGAGLLACAITSPAGASLPRLIDGVRVAIAGRVSPTVAALAKGAAMTGLIKKAIFATVLVTATGLAVLGFGEPQGTTAGSPADKTMPAKEAPKVAPASPETAIEQTYTGRVLDPDGKPLGGAKLFSEKELIFEAMTRADISLARVGETNADGTFRVTLKSKENRPRRYLVASEDGFGVDWAELAEAKANEPITLRLVKDRPIVGRVLNTEGKPLVGISVSTAAIYVPANDRLDDYLAGWRKNWREVASTPRKRLYIPLDAIHGAIVTDADGKFTLRGVGAERIAHLNVSGKGIAQSTPYVIMRDGFQPKTYNEEVKDDSPPGFRSRRMVPVLFGPDMTFVAEPGVTIAGVVTDSVTGKPVAGCSIGSSIGFGEGIVARTDAFGAYTLAGIPSEKTGYRVSARPTKATGYLSRNALAKDADGLGAIKLDIDLIKGAVVTGQIVDRATGKGVTAGIRFAPLAGNKFFGSKPGFDNYSSDRTMESTDAEGRFKLLTIPGPAMVMAQIHSGEKFHGEHLSPYRLAVPSDADRKQFKYDAEDNTWTIETASGTEFLSTENAMQIIDVKPEGETKVELFAERGATATLAVHDATGKPLSGAWVAGLTEHWPITYRLPDSIVKVYALDPKKPRTLAVYHPEKKLGGTVVIRGDETEPVAVKLGPLGGVTGLLRDTDGTPLAGVDVSIRPVGTIGSELERFANPSGKPVRTAGDGRFKLSGVVPGMPFYLQVRQGDEFYGGAPKIGQRTVKPGETLDIGERKMEPLR